MNGEPEESVEPLHYARKGHQRPLSQDDDPKVMRMMTVALSAMVLTPMLVGIIVVLVLLIL